MLRSVKLASRVYPGIRGHPGYHQPPVVLVHGLFGNKQNWMSVGKQLAGETGRLVVGIDTRNHGDLPHALPHDYPHMASDVIAYLEGLRQDSPLSDKHKPDWGNGAVLVGHLMGAKVVMAVALERPDLVERLVVVDNSPVAERLDQQFYNDLEGMCEVQQQQQHAPPLPHKHQLKRIDEVLAKYEPSRLVRVFLMSNLKGSRKDEPLQFRIPVLQLRDHDVLSRIEQWPDTSRRFSKPVLVMRGLRSPFVQDRHLQNFRQYFDHVSTVDFDCGHWLVSEQPTKFVKELKAFIKS